MNLSKLDKKDEEVPNKYDFKKFVLEWNDKHPLDIWWRKKYNVPFGSKSHLEMEFFHMRIEFEEDRILKEQKKLREEQENSDEDKALYGTLNEKDKDKVVKMNKKEVDDEFDNLDINSIK